MQPRPYHWTVLALLAFALCCVGLACSWPGDREALKRSCSVAWDACVARCKGNYRCTAACNGGLHDCTVHVDQERPRDWQPADAFYDGCKDACPDGCEGACSAGQSAAACDSGDRLRKYGTISFCP